MKKAILSLSIFFIPIIYSLACTTFVIKTENELVFGRNLDWLSDIGIIAVNKRNVNKTSLVFPPEKPIDWTSKYGSVSFNQYGVEFPFGGINEKGLVIEIMLAPAQYEKYDRRKAVNELQWIQYHLDNSASIEDVISSKDYLQISPIEQQLHYLVCDSSGNTAVIEFINNSMVVYKDDNLPVSVLENEPYKTSLTNFKNNSECRFTTAAQMVKNYEPEKPIIDYSFQILNEVVLSGEWSIVYDIKKMKVYFKTVSNKKTREFAINTFNFDCSSPTLIYDLQQSKGGKIDNLFMSFNAKFNKEKIKDAVRLNNNLIPDDMLLQFNDYHKSCSCLN